MESETDKFNSIRVNIIQKFRYLFVTYINTIHLFIRTHKKKKKMVESENILEKSLSRNLDALIKKSVFEKCSLLI